MLIKIQRRKKYVRLRFFSCPFACITAAYSEHEHSTTSSKWLLPPVLNSTYCFPKLWKQQQKFTLWSRSLKAYQSSFLLFIVFILLKTTAIQIHKLPDLRPALYNYETAGLWLFSVYFRRCIYVCILLLQKKTASTVVWRGKISPIKQFKEKCLKC